MLYYLKHLRLKNRWRITELLYIGVGWTIVGYAEIIAQKHINETFSALMMLLKSKTAALAGRLFLNQILSIKELVAYLLMLIAVIACILSQTKRFDRK